jgi:hypothetical protein
VQAADRQQRQSLLADDGSSDVRSPARLRSGRAELKASRCAQALAETAAEISRRVLTFTDLAH